MFGLHGAVFLRDSGSVREFAISSRDRFDTNCDFEEALISIRLGSIRDHVSIGEIILNRGEHLYFSSSTSTRRGDYLR